MIHFISKALDIQKVIVIPVSDTTPFFTGKFSEIMITCAILKLIEEKKISLEDPVIKHLSYFRLGNDSYKNITIRHLLTQTSGIPQHSAVWDIPDYSDTALELTTKSIRFQQPLFSPSGSKVKRSQYAFDILADMITKLSKMDFGSYMNKTIIPSFGMNNSAYFTTKIPDSIPWGHEISDWLLYSLKTKDSYPFNRQHQGSIGLHASIKDIANWIFKLLHNNYFKAKSSNVLFKPQYRTGSNSFIGLA